MKRLFVFLMSLGLLTGVFAQTGDIAWEIFPDYSGDLNAIKDLTSGYNTLYRTSLAAPKNFGGTFGARLNGYFYADTTGYYTFYTCGRERSALFLSSDHTFENLEIIAYSDGRTGDEQWDKYSYQQSTQIKLYKGEFYRLVSVYKCWSNGDYHKIGVIAPGSESISVVQSANISQEAQIDSTANDIVFMNIPVKENDLDFETFYQIDNGTHTVNIDVPVGTNISALITEFRASPLATATISNGDTVDYTSVSTITVTSAKGDVQDWTINMNVLPLQSVDTITSFYLKELDQMAVIDNVARTITISYLYGFTDLQTAVIELPVYATIDPPSATVIDPNDPPQFTVTAQDGTEAVYTVVQDVIIGVRGFYDGFDTDTNLTRWNQDGNYKYFHDPANEELKIWRSGSDNKESSFTFPENMNLLGVEKLRMRVNTPVELWQNGVMFRLKDGSGTANKKWQEVKVLSNQLDQFVECLVSFPLNDPNPIDYSDIDQMLFAINRQKGIDGDDTVRIDDLSVGIDAMPNLPPTFEPVTDPEYIEVADGQQMVTITGITNGNEQRNEIVTITAKSSDLAVVEIDSVQYDGISDTANVYYKPAGTRGFSDITVTLQDDQGFKWSNDIGNVDSLTFMVEVRDPAVNNPPSIGTVSTPKIYVGKGPQVVIIPNIDDGDIDKEQTVTILDAASSDEGLVVVDSIVYDSTHHMALLYVTEKVLAGTVEISITLQDDGGTGGSGTDTYMATFDLEVGDYETDAETGVSFEYYDVKHWQPRPTANDVPVPGSYQNIKTTETPIKNLDKDFFWSKMYGYIIPKETGAYVFSGYSNEGIHFFINLDDGVSTDFDDLTSINEGPGSFTSDLMSLVGGKVYYFEAFSRDIINSQPFWIKWAGPGFSEKLIEEEFLLTAVDFINPTTPENFSVLKTGSNEMLISWDPSEDNNKIRGYNVYLDGELIEPELKDTVYNIIGLDSVTAYTVTVEAVDNYSNKSHPAELITNTTYGVDETAPAPPQNVVHTMLSSDAIKLAWDEVIDNETETRGYNIFMDGNQLNSVPVIVNSFTYSDLEPKTAYSFTVSAIDANYNPSAESTPYDIVTPKFGPEPVPFSENYKARVSFTTEAIDQFPGFGLHVNHSPNSMLSANRISYGYFEDARYDTLGLSSVGKSTDGVTFSLSTDEPFSGEYSAKISGSQNKHFRCEYGTKIHGNDYDFLIRFACKKDPLYDGDLVVTLKGRFVSTIFTGSITPTEDWQVYELEFSTTYDGIEPLWYLDFVLQNTGAVYLDNIEFYEKQNYVPGSKFSKIGVQRLKEFNPTGVRWGGIGANSLFLDRSIGPFRNGLTMGDLVHLSNTYGGGYTYFCNGMAANTDWYNDPTAFTKWMDYMGADTTTEGGKMRVEEGYDDLLSGAQSVILEFGNEVWAGNGHNAPVGEDYVAYGNWCRDMATYVKQSPGYDPDKVKLAYSGRRPGSNYGLHQDMLGEDDGSVDYLSLSGYMGGNLDYEPGIDFGDAVADYHKNGYDNMMNKFQAFDLDKKETITLTGRQLPLYMYEGNMTTPSYTGTVGQAIAFTDYYTGALRMGTAHTVMFAFGPGGQWSMTKDDINYEGKPLYHTGALLNNHCKGVNLVTTVTTERTIANADGKILNLDPIGAYAFYTEDDRYAVVLFNRDVEHDYEVQVDLPDDINQADFAERYVIYGDAVDARDVIMENDTITSFDDSLVVNVPLYGMTLLVFDGDPQTYTDIPMVSTEYQRVTSVTIVPETTSVIDEDEGILVLSAQWEPSDAFVQEGNWEFVGDNLDATMGGYLEGVIVKAGGSCNSNGTFTVKVSSVDDPMVYDEIEISVSNQQNPGGCDVMVDENIDELVNMYPVPANEILNIDLPVSNAIITISDMNGRVLKTRNVGSNHNEINLSSLKSGVYIVNIQVGDKTIIKRFSKL
jgi:hypothetical protein